MSGRINYSNLSDSLKEQLNGLGLTEEQVNELIENALVDKVGELNGLMTEEKGDLVGAINELFQSANNGKELIANAIGEPLDSNDTFSAMSTDINGLLSTFKTNMMNNGITVESSDKFKSLIDKIATMVEEGSGKGIQFAEGIIKNSVTPNFYTTTTYTFNESLTFEPNFLFLVFETITDSNASGYGVTSYFNNFVILDYVTHTSSLNPEAILVSNITNEGFTITVNYPLRYSGNISYYVIGVGEEDTTLRDSLASILTEEGVSVTEEDDMASLISKVDSEFNDKNTEIASKVTPAGNAVASNVLSGKTFINSTGQVVTGSMANMSTHTQVADYVAWNTQSIYLGIPAGAYINASSTGYPEVYIEKTRLDSNLVPENIVSGKSICGVAGTYKGPAIKAGTTCQIHYYVNRITANTVIPDTDGDRYYSLGEFSYNTYTNNLMDMQSIRVRFRYATDDDNAFIGNSEEECDSNDRYANPILMKVVHKRGSTTIKTVTKYGTAPRAGSNCDIDLSDVKKGDVIDFRVKFLNGLTAWEVIEYCALLCTTN